MKKFKIFLLNILLFFVAGLLLILFTFIGLITALLAIIFHGASTNYFRDCALELDIFGNILCQHLFNTFLIKENSKYTFGVLGMTISKNLGLNQRENTLSNIGNGLVKLLDYIDKDHCKKAIKE